MTSSNSVTGLSFLSAPSANALISELRPTTLSPPALAHVNALIDEILSLLISNAESINPSHIRTQGIPAVFTGDKTAGETTGPKALGRSAVAEAEIELRSWYEINPGARRAAFGQDGSGTGVKGGREFPVREAIDLLKLKCVQYSTLSPTAPLSDAYEAQVINAWRIAGGDATDTTLSPAGLWTTAILEHICEHVLGQLSRVVARDSSIAVAGVQDLYVALCEDESIWGLFKRLQESLESAIKATTRQRKTTPIKSSQSQLLGGSHSNHGSKTSLPNSTSLRDTSLDQSRNSSSTPVEHVVESPSRRGPISAVSRAVSSSHHRSSSLLSTNTKNIVSAFNDQYDSDHLRRPSADEDEFDALVRSGETMKVSLTPSRLKNFDVSPNRRAPPSPTQAKYVRATRPTQSPELPAGDLSPLTPTNVQMEGEPKRHGPGARVHSRSSSGQRLVARNAATIKEQDNEDAEEEILDGPKSGAKKESLADMFASEPKEKMQSSRRSSGSSKRLVPAVVLGSPPPKEKEPEHITTSSQNQNQDPTSTSVSTIGRKTKRNDLTVNTPLTTSSTTNQITSTSTSTGTGIGSTRKGRSEAQELADFFNSTQPPDEGITRAPTSGMDDREPPKSAKSFKSFMSRMTGKKDKDKSSANPVPPMPSAYKDTGGGVKRQKSFQSFMSNGTATAAAAAAAAASMENAVSSNTSKPPTTAANRSVEHPYASNSNKSTADTKTSDPKTSAALVGVPSYPSTNALQQSSSRTPEYPATLSKTASDAKSSGPISADQMLAVGVAAMTMGAGEGTKAVRPEQRMDEVGSAKVKDEGEIPSEADTTPKPARPARGPRTGVPAMDSTAAAPKSVNPTEPSGLAPPIATNANDYVMVDKADALPPKTPVQIDTLSSAPRGFEHSQSPVRPTPSTAGHSQFPSEAASFTTASEGNAQPDPAGSESKQPELVPASAPAPSIPVSDLVALRGLLQHATTARECQLLLGAILSQMGVPLSSGSTEVLDPEARVTAWLLAGRDGPSDYPSNTREGGPMTATTSSGMEVMTPVLGTKDLDVGQEVKNSDPADGEEDELELGKGSEHWETAVRNPEGEEAMRVREEVMGV